MLDQLQFPKKELRSRAVAQLDLITGFQQFQSPRECLVRVHSEAAEVQSPCEDSSRGAGWTPPP